MLGHTQLLAVEGLSVKGRQRLEVMEAQIRRMVTLVESCMPQAPPVRLAAVVDIAATIDNVVGEVGDTCEAHGIQVTSTTDGSLPCVRGHAGDLHRLLMNVFTNAADAMPDGGRILVRARTIAATSSTEAAVEIAITDTGAGIPPDALPRIFERGFTTKAPGQGSGLGLAICEDIARAHGGRIQLRTGVGRGTTVTIWLPGVGAAPR